jgi:hypothetical protein
LIRRKIVENKEEKISFREFLKWLRFLIIRVFFLIFVISIFKSFLGRGFDIDYEEKIQMCSEYEDVESEAKSLLEIIYNHSREELQQKEINEINEIYEVDSAKKFYTEKIKKLLTSTKLNINNLNLYFDEKNKIWRENYFLSLFKNDPIKSLIIYPLNIVSENVERILFREKLGNFNFFFLDIFVKLVLCNLFIYLLFENIDDNFPFPNIKEKIKTLENQDLNSVSLKDLQEKITEIFFDIFIFIFFGIFIIQNKSFLNREIPEKIKDFKIELAVAEVFLIIVMPLIIKKIFFKKNKDEEKKNVFFEIFMNILLKILLIRFDVLNIKLQFIWFMNTLILTFLKFFAHALKFLKTKEENPL